MTDPNKAAVTESNAQFVARMPALPADIRPVERVSMPGEDYIRLRSLAEERVMIEEHRLSIHAPYSNTLQGWLVASTKLPRTEYEHASFSTAIRSVVAKIGEK